MEHPTLPDERGHSKGVRKRVERSRLVPAPAMLPEQKPGSDVVPATVGEPPYDVAEGL